MTIGGDLTVTGDINGDLIGDVTGNVTGELTLGTGVSVISISDGEFTTGSSVIVVMSLPTSDPSNAGQLWANAGVVTVSAG